MRHSLPKRAEKKPSLAISLKACPKCLGDLVLKSERTGGYACPVCGAQIEPRPQVPQASRADKTAGPALP